MTKRGKKSFKCYLCFQEECAYIVHYTGRGPNVNTKYKKLPFPPFRYILTSPAVLSMFLYHMGMGWGVYLLMTGIPTYLDNIQHYQIRTVIIKLE